MVVLHTALHVLELVQDGEHVDELPQREEVRLRHKVLTALRVAQPPDLPAEPVYGRTLGGRSRRGRGRNKGGGGGGRRDEGG